MAPLSLIGASLSAETLREEFRETYALSAGGSFWVQNTNGSLEIVSWDENEVLVEATKFVKALGRERAQEAMEALEINVEESADRVAVKTKQPKASSGFMSWLFGHNVDAKVSYRVKVPRGIHVRALTVNGNVDIHAVDGFIDAETTNGQIRISEARSSASASTTNGSIRAEFSELRSVDDMNFRTTNGGITVYAPSDLECSLSASTVNGAVSTDFAVTVEGSKGASRKKLKGDINGGGGELSLRTVNGSIALRKSD